MPEPFQQDCPLTCPLPHFHFGSRQMNWRRGEGPCRNITPSIHARAGTHAGSCAKRRNGSRVPAQTRLAQDDDILQASIDTDTPRHPGAHCPNSSFPIVTAGPVQRGTIRPPQNQFTTPPLICSNWPLMKPPLSEQSSPTAAAISSARPRRPAGFCLRSF